MSRRGRLAALGVGTSASAQLPWWQWLADVGPAYVEGVPVAASMQPQAPSATRTALASSSSLNAALAAGADPSVVQTVYALGASDAELQQVAAGALDPVSLLSYLTGNSPAPGQPVTSAANYPAAALPPAAGTGWGAAATLLSPDTYTGAGSIGDWLSSYWPWLALGGIGILWLSRKL